MPSFAPSPKTKTKKNLKNTNIRIFEEQVALSFYFFLLALSSPLLSSIFAPAAITMSSLQWDIVDLGISLSRLSSSNTTHFGNDCKDASSMFKFLDSYTAHCEPVQIGSRNQLAERMSALEGAVQRLKSEIDEAGRAEGDIALQEPESFSESAVEALKIYDKLSTISTQSNLISASQTLKDARAMLDAAPWKEGDAEDGKVRDGILEYLAVLKAWINSRINSCLPSLSSGSVASTASSRSKHQQDLESVLTMVKSGMLEASETFGSLQKAFDASIAHVSCRQDLLAKLEAHLGPLGDTVSCIECDARVVAKVVFIDVVGDSWQEDQSYAEISTSHDNVNNKKNNGGDCDDGGSDKQQTSPSAPAPTSVTASELFAEELSKTTRKILSLGYKHVGSIDYRSIIHWKMRKMVSAHHYVLCCCILRRVSRHCIVCLLRSIGAFSHSIPPQATTDYSSHTNIVEYSSVNDLSDVGASSRYKEVKVFQQIKEVVVNGLKLCGLKDGERYCRSLLTLNRARHPSQESLQSSILLVNGWEVLALEVCAMGLVDLAPVYRRLASEGVKAIVSKVLKSCGEFPELKLGNSATSVSSYQEQWYHARNYFQGVESRVRKVANCGHDLNENVGRVVCDAIMNHVEEVVWKVIEEAVKVTDDDRDGLEQCLKCLCNCDVCSENLREIYNFMLLDIGQVLQIDKWANKDKKRIVTMIEKSFGEGLSRDKVVNKILAGG